jgi:hypothetical protein
MHKVQLAVYGCEGSINKILVDDKGLLILVALGLPPMHHCDDCTRAVCAALSIVDAIKVYQSAFCSKPDTEFHQS